MNDGIINFIEPKDCTIKHRLGDYKIKKFDRNNFTSVDELLDIYEREGVTSDEFDGCSS